MSSSRKKLSSHRLLFASHGEREHEARQRAAALGHQLGETLEVEGISELCRVAGCRICGRGITVTPTKAVGDCLVIKCKRS